MESTIVRVDKGTLEAALKNITIARKIDNLIEADAFHIDIGDYRKHEEIIKTNGMDDELTQLLIEADKVVIDNRDRLMSFLHMTQQTIVSPVIDPNQYYVSFKKRRIKTKTKASSK
jgi:hypothetical protein